MQRQWKEEKAVGLKPFQMGLINSSPPEKCPAEIPLLEV